MSYSKALGSALTHTKLRTPDHVSPFSGMCSVCTSNCTGSCEIGLSAVRGPEAIYPHQSDINQFASEKDYPLDFSHLNINGRVFGAWGCQKDSEEATFPKVNISSFFGKSNMIKMKSPIILPAMAKLNWRDYYAGAALAGVAVVIGEDVVGKDQGLLLKEGRVMHSPLLAEMVQAFREYDIGFGDIIVQANVDDENLGVLEYAIQSLGVKSVELKFGQAAKGIQGMGRVKNIDEALRFQKMGYLIYPDPSDLQIAENYKKGIGQVFEKIGKLPMWDMEILTERVQALKKMGAQRVCFKSGPYDVEDLVMILKIASRSGVDLVTFDGAGGGTGNSPVRMMDEWGLPTVELESRVYDILHKMEEKGYELPQVAITGGFSMEDHVFKGLALGAPYINLIGIGRAAMAAAMTGKQIGDLIKAGKTPKELDRFGNTVEDVFEEIKKLRVFYGSKVDSMSTGAIGLYSYIQRVSTGLQQLMALNRKFAVEHINRDDLIPLTDLAATVTGLKDSSARLKQALKDL